VSLIALLKLLINNSPDFMFNHRKFSTSCSHMLKKLFFNCTCSNKMFVTYYILFKKWMLLFYLKSNNIFAIDYCIICLSLLRGFTWNSSFISWVKSNKFSIAVKKLCVRKPMQRFQIIYDHVLRWSDMKIKPFLSLKLTLSLLSKSAFIGKIHKFYIIYGENYWRSFTSC
jgi:hypothetical protein